MHVSVVERRWWWSAFNFSNKTNPKGNIDDSACPALKGLCHDSAHAWAVTVADCLWTNRKRVTCTRGNLHNSRFIAREARVFRTFLFDFIYPHNSYLFSGIPQINVAADKNKITNPVLLWSKHVATCIFMYPREKTSLRSAIKNNLKTNLFLHQNANLEKLSTRTQIKLPHMRRSVSQSL